MTAYYLDTSATVKLFVREPGTRWLRRLVEPHHWHSFHTSRLTGPECIAAIFRKVRTGQLDLPTANRAATRFRSHWLNRFAIIEVNQAIAEDAMDLAERHGLRGYDSVHFATAIALQRGRLALQLSTLTFVSADIAQLQAALAERLRVENPSTRS